MAFPYAGTMSAAVATLVLLFCLSLTRADAQGNENAPERVQVDMWAELRALRDMVVEQRVELRLMGERVRGSDSQLDQLKRENAALETKLSSSKSRVEDLSTRLTSSESRVEQMSTRLTSSESRVVQLSTRLTSSESRVEDLSTRLTSSESKVEDLSTRLTSSESKVEDLSTTLTSSESRVEDLSTRLTSSESRVEDLIADRAKVAFSASLQSHLGPVGGNTIVVYGDVVTNKGQAYNPLTGAFKAPVKGIYYFRFTSLDDRKGIWIGINIRKNGQNVLSNAVGNNGGYTYLSNAIVMELENGDVVDIQLHSGCKLFGGPSRPTNFSGFLLFPL